MRKTILVFGLLILALLLLFQLSKYAVVFGHLNIEIAIAAIAVLFFFIGIYINKKSLNKKALPVQEIDLQKIKALDITEREYEVLQGISDRSFQ